MSKFLVMNLIFKVFVDPDTDDIIFTFIACFLARCQITRIVDHFHNSLFPLPDGNLFLAVSSFLLVNTIQVIWSINLRVNLCILVHLVISQSGCENKFFSFIYFFRSQLLSLLVISLSYPPLLKTNWHLINWWENFSDSICFSKEIWVF